MKENMTMPRSKESLEKKLKYNENYTKENTTLIAIRMQNKKDMDVIKKINSMPNKAEYIRQLVRADMQAKQNPDKK